MKYFVREITTPLGEMILAADDSSILALLWNKKELARIGIEAFSKSDSVPHLKRAAKQIQEYFAGTRKTFDLPLDLRGTPFQKRVWKELQRIPFGKTWSYQELARRMGHPTAIRAVGSANGKNPVCILVPCHRVVRLSGELGGYAGGLKNKAFLLELENRPTH